MTVQDKIEWLANCGEWVRVRRLSYPLRALHKILSMSDDGWLRITDHGDLWSVVWMSGRGIHNPLLGPAISVDIAKDTGLLDSVGPWTGAWTVWGVGEQMRPVKDKKAANITLDRIAHLVGIAFESRQ